MNDETFTPTTEKLTQDKWWLILWLLLAGIPEQEWGKFAHDLIYKDRFSSSHKVVDVIKGFSEKCTVKIKKGQVLYRARIYHQEPLREFLTDVFKHSAANKSSDMNDSPNVYYDMQLPAIIMAVGKGESTGQRDDQSL